MKYCADTWYFIELSKNESKALNILKDLNKRKNKLIIPSIVIMELTRRAIKTGKMGNLEEFLNSINSSVTIEIIDCDVQIAKEAGILSATYNIPSVDSIIAATGIIHNCHKLISKDSHFKMLSKRKIIKLIFW